MIRLFVALELPPAVRDALLAVMGGVSGAHWQRDDQLHLTLRFIGEVDRHTAADISAALARVNFMPLTLALDGIGTFDRRGRVDALWVGVAPRAPVAGLAKRIDAALAKVGLPPDTRAFVPHITVARLGRSAGSIGAFPMAPVPALPFVIRSFALWESRLGVGGFSYEIVDRYSVRG
jgi:2'-5' RNA ligase